MAESSWLEYLDTVRGESKTVEKEPCRQSNSLGSWERSSCVSGNQGISCTSVSVTINQVSSRVGLLGRKSERRACKMRRRDSMVRHTRYYGQGVSDLSIKHLRTALTHA